MEMIEDKPLSWTNQEGFLITTNPKLIDLNRLHNYLALEAYWSRKIPRNILEKGLKHSLNFSLISPKENQFVGFARVITDYATFGWLADVFIDKDFRGKNLGKWLISTILEYPDLKNLRNFLLFTLDAHSLYQRFGWKPLEDPSILLAIKKSPEELYGHI